MRPRSATLKSIPLRSNRLSNATSHCDSRVRRHTGYRESALIWALSSAGAAWGVATACAQGWIDDCSCAHDGQPGWEYGGCSFSVQHGITASRKLLTKTPVIRTPLRSVEKHNLKAGRLAVKKTLIASCKCHGVSGSCQQKTCWKKTATLDHITDYLVEKYARAKLITGEQKAKTPIWCIWNLHRIPVNNR
ncbi:wnt family protein [Ancylostoma duodenale]|uniref:Protein Wnt n=1 Tax=Ancylostoma duodenale TaxID=51022 RepID=A0A0C2GG76_9BILA|nr:wnt family protein [Ancylostoma duodenale]